MSTIKSSAENLTLNADGANNDIKFQSNGTEVASIDQAGNVIAEGGVYVTGELQVTQAANNEAIDVSTNGTTTNAIRVIASALTTGKAAQIYSNSASTGTRNLVEIWNDHADSTGATALYVDNDSTGLAADFQGTGGIRSAGGIKFGTDTAAANALDDYEEGTWTPTITFGGNSASVAYSTQTGHYTKIGRAVTLYGHVALSNKGSSTGHLNIAGLPFTPAGDYAPVSLRFQNLSFADMATAIVSSGATTVIFYETANGGAETSLTNSNAANNTRILFQTTYRV